MKRTATLVAMLALLMAVSSMLGCAKENEAADVPSISAAPITAGDPIETTEPEVTEPEGGEENNEEVDPMTVEKINATIVVKNFGTIELELYPSLAPQSVSNFCYLARQGYYDGLIFHRVISGFMIQGGDPDGTGRGGPGYCIKGEFALNGIANDLSHTRGVISMARKSNSCDSAGSQFFIMHADYTGLDGQYAAFGKVTSGIEVVDAIAAVKTSSAQATKDRPLEDVVIESITIDGPLFPEPEKLPEV